MQPGLLPLCFIYFLAALILPRDSQAQEKRFYIANDDHTDYMWTANEALYDSAFVHMLDYYLNEIDVTKTNPDNLQARFNCDGSYWVKVYAKYRTPQQYARLVAALRSGHISIPLNSLVSTYGAQPTEAVLRGMYDAGFLERDLGLRFPLAVCMENQTLPLGLSALWAGSGAKYSWRGVCGCASKMPETHFRNRRHQLYHYTGLDGSSVLMKWYNLGGNNTFLGGYSEARGGEKPIDTVGSIRSVIENLDSLCSQGEKNKTYPYRVAGAFGYGWDDLQTYVSPAFIKAAAAGTNSSRKIRVSNEEDFFEDIAKTYPVLPKETVSYGNEWDLYCASMNETTARVRRATEKLRNAEAVASVASLKNEVFLASLAPQRRLAWEAYGLYWEHDWTADGPVSKKDRADWQIKMQQRISTYSDSLLALSVSTLGKQLRSSGKRCFFVFNALGWKRNDIADFKYGGPYPVQVIDQSTGEEVPSQLIIKGSEKYLRLLASDVPAVGYKTFEIREGKPAISPPAAVFDGKYLRNRFYRLRLTRSGAITELYDSLAGSRQLAALTDGRYINDIGAVDVNHGEPLVVESAGPVSLTLKAVSNDPLPHAVRITLFKHSPRIEIEDSLLANFSDVKTWSFSFNLNDAVARHEELGSVLTAKKENHGGHYAAVNARYDWLTFNHFADVSEKRYGITLSNLDCSFFKLGQSTPDSLWEFSTQVNALAGGQTDNLNDSTSKKNLGIVAQNGDSAFLYHFALQTHSTPFDATSSMKYSLEHVNPLVTGVITGMADASPRTSYSLVSIDQPDVILWGIKPAEEEKGALVARWWNLGNQRKHAVVRFSEKVEEVWRTSHIETPEVRASLVHENLSIPLNQHQLATYKIIVKESRPVAK